MTAPTNRVETPEGQAGRPLRLTVAVPTYRRPAALARLLPMVVRQTEELRRDPAAPAATLLVVDNDPGGSAEPVCRPWATTALRYVAEPEPGLAAVRNRILDEAADADLLIMIDDDETPRPGWLAALLAVWRTEEPALVAGRVVPEYAAPVDPWVAAGAFFDRPLRRTGTTLRAAATSNLLLDVGQVRRLGVRFDPRFGLTGGEDSQFSRRLADAGGRILWCAESVVTDHVPAHRTTRRWVLDRARNFGNIHARIDLELSARKRLARLRRTAVAAVLVLAGSGRWLVGTATRSLRHQARGRRLMMRGRGMFDAVRGVSHQEYADRQ